MPEPPLPDAVIARLQFRCEEPDLAACGHLLGPELGRGGMGVVYRAHDPELGRDVALKVVPVADADRPDALERLRREARTLARLEHPGIVPVHTVGVLPDGRIFYTMRLVQGERLDRFAAAGPDRPLPEMLRLFVRVCETVAFAHAAGVVHRDLKPANLMVGAFGDVLVLDWGLAHSAGDGISPRRQGGTRGFMAPEQESGDAGEIEPRTDVFALGAVLRFLAGCGGRPTPNALRSIIARATATVPASRYAAVSDLAADVLRFLDGERVTAHRESIWERLTRLIRRHRVLLGLVLAYLVMRAVLFFFLPG